MGKLKLWRVFFLLAGCYNLAGGFFGLLDLESSFERMGREPPNYPFAFQILLVAVMILGVGYLMLAKDPQRHRGIAWLGLLTKLDGFGFTVWAISSGQLPRSAWWQPVVNDLIWAVGFAVFLATVPGRPAKEPSGK